ncbi:hypothetical protein M2272_001760 [Mycobacterium frederiksbergense]|uniref:Integral membrane protein n=1 Tax=Mycolicibacterium frederiksbergense TaxID=117567 RepID=A0ABT6KWP6_9MYCO|nr:hypothetical protein [Mycolicibacterium frederiksbergense]MDH6195131.1 hypothetical protein [Mycolicibacterium frederiksbergense]
MASSQSADPRVAEQWFLDSGLPAVLRPGVLVRRVWTRSAPALAAFATMMAASVVIVALTGKHTIDIDGTPTRTEWFVLAIIVFVLPAAALIGWLVSRLTDRQRRVVPAVALVVIVLGGVFGGPSSRLFVDLVLEAVAVALILLCTATGIGSILGWAVRMAMENVSSVGSLLVRALPVVLLTVLVFFNAPVWLMAELVTRGRLWLALGLLFVIAVAFLLSSTLETVRPMLQSTEKAPADLSGTPFEHLPDRAHRVPLSRPERANVVFVLAVSQTLQVLTVALVTASIFFVLGLILLNPPLLAAWTRNGSTTGEILGMTLPVPQALIQITLFLAALTFMYLGARAVSDKEYRSIFFDPLVDQVRLTLAARDRYRTATATHQSGGS